MARYKRYDWEALKQKFMLGDYKSLREFAEREGLKYNRHFTQKTKGWAEERKEKRRQKVGKIVEDVLEEQVRHEVDWNTRHLEAWGKFLRIITEAVEDHTRHFVSEKSGKLNVYALEKAASVLKMAQEGQRKALGMDGKDAADAEMMIAERVRDIVAALRPEAEDVHQESDEEA